MLLGNRVITDKPCPYETTWKPTKLLMVTHKSAHHALWHTAADFAVQMAAASYVTSSYQ